MEKGKCYLVTTNDWFFNKDGLQYKCIWGKGVIKKAEEILGLTPKQSTNWFLEIGEGENKFFIGGCQINYVQSCPERPSAKDILIVD